MAGGKLRGVLSNTKPVVVISFRNQKKKANPSAICVPAIVTGENSANNAMHIMMRFVRAVFLSYAIAPPMYLDVSEKKPVSAQKRQHEPPHTVQEPRFDKIYFREFHAGTDKDIARI